MKPSPSLPVARSPRVHAHLLGERLPQAPHQPGTFVWEADADPARRSYLVEHKLLGNTVWPISAQIELALAAARDALGVERCRITSLEFRQTLYSLEPGAVLAAGARAGPGLAAFPFFAPAPPPLIYLAWALAWNLGAIGLAIFSLERRDL